MQTGVQCDFHTGLVSDPHKTTNFINLAQNQSLHHRHFNNYTSLRDYRLIKFFEQNLDTFNRLPFIPINRDFPLFLNIIVAFKKKKTLKKEGKEKTKLQAT